MSKERLNQLIELLAEFRDEMDEQDAKSIEKASSMTLAAKLEDQHQKNIYHIDFVLRWVNLKKKD
jgi:hypothetical protein